MSVLEKIAFVLILFLAIDAFIYWVAVRYSKFEDEIDED